MHDVCTKDVWGDSGERLAPGGEMCAVACSGREEAMGHVSKNVSLFGIERCTESLVYLQVGTHTSEGD
jgi:hypothetical protein